MSSELCSSVIMSALNAENIAEAVKRKNEPDIARIQLNKETTDMLEASMKVILKTFPAFAKSQKQTSKTRY